MNAPNSSSSRRTSKEHQNRAKAAASLEDLAHLGRLEAHAVGSGQAGGAK